MGFAKKMLDFKNQFFKITNLGAQEEFGDNFWCLGKLTWSTLYQKLSDLDLGGWSDRNLAYRVPKPIKMSSEG